MDRFEEFWKAYPSRNPHANPKKPAHTAFLRAIKRGATADALIKAAHGYAQYVKAHGVKSMYVAMSTTFLNQDRYDQYEDQKKLVTMEDILNGN